jgi:hypothetical protein
MPTLSNRHCHSRWASRAPLGSAHPKDPLGRLRIPSRSKLGPSHPWNPLAPLGRHRPACAPIGPRGPKDPRSWEASWHGQLGQQARNPIRTSLQAKISIDNRRRRSSCCACAAIDQTTAPSPRNELPPVHSITSSAIASSVGGTSMPRARAVRRLITNSNFVASWTGSSAAFSPLRMRPA